MATITFAGGVVFEPTNAFPFIAMPFQGSLMNPYQGDGHRPVPFLSASTFEPPGGMLLTVMPYNGGTIAPARGGTAVVSAPFYWGGIRFG